MTEPSRPRSNGRCFSCGRDYWHTYWLPARFHLFPFALAVEGEYTPVKEIEAALLDRCLHTGETPWQAAINILRQGLDLPDSPRMKLAPSSPPYPLPQLSTHRV